MKAKMFKGFDKPCDCDRREYVVTSFILGWCVVRTCLDCGAIQCRTSDYFKTYTEAHDAYNNLLQPSESEYE